VFPKSNPSFKTVVLVSVGSRQSLAPILSSYMPATILISGIPRIASKLSP